MHSSFYILKADSKKVNELITEYKELSLQYKLLKQFAKERDDEYTTAIKKWQQAKTPSSKKQANIIRLAKQLEWHVVEKLVADIWWQKESVKYEIRKSSQSPL